MTALAAMAKRRSQMMVRIQELDQEQRQRHVDENFTRGHCRLPSWMLAAIE